MFDMMSLKIEQKSNGATIYWKPNVILSENRMSLRYSATFECHTEMVCKTNVKLETELKMSVTFNQNDCHVKSNVIHNMYNFKKCQ